MEIPLTRSKNVEAPLITKQIELEKLYSKNQLTRRIRKEFEESEIDFTQCFEDYDIPIDFGYDMLVQICLHKRADVSTMVGILRKHDLGLQETADLLLKCAEIDLINYDPGLGQFIVEFEISEDVQAEIDRYQFPLPMVTEPRKLNSNRETGYLLGSGSVILKNNHTDDDVCLDHLNRVNAIPLALDMDTATMVRNSWRNLDKKKEDETNAEFKARKKAFERYEQATKDVMEQLVETSDRIYITHRYDKRGRCYSMGYHINPQGNSWSKACLELADKEIIE